MHSIRRDFWIWDNQSLLWSASWSYERKTKLSQSINKHWFLDNYSSLDILEFLIWEQWLNKILEFKNDLIKKWLEWLALDIDQTLSYTWIYWFEKLLSLYWNPENLTANEMSDKYTFYENVPYWSINPDIIKKMYEFRDSNEHQLEIPIIEWTNLHYSRIHREIISILSYITVRPDSVSDWTSTWINSNGFPVAEVIHIPRELEFMLWNLWKACVLDVLYPNIVWIVDDNPSLIKMLPSSYKGEIFLFNKEENCNYNHINIHVSETIGDVIKNIEKVFL